MQMQSINWSFVGWMLSFLLGIVVITETIYMSTQPVCNCTGCGVYGVLSFGAVIWAKDFNGSTIPGSTVISSDGSMTAGLISWAYQDPNTNIVCLSAKRRVCG